MKNAKANTPRVRQAIARFGKSALHPLCEAALRFWQIDAEFSKLTKKALEVKELVNSSKQERGRAVALVRRLADQKRKEVAQAAAILRDIDNELLPKTQKWYEATLKLWSGCDFNHKVAAVLFKRERASYKGDNQAQKALQQTRKRWDAISNGKPLKASDARALGILRMLRDKAFRAAVAKGGPVAGYWEAASGGDRALSDEFWQGRLTAREIHSGLKATGAADVAGDKDAKEVRRDAKKLGIRLAEDQRGRKWKEPRPDKQEPARTRGRPRTKIEEVFSKDGDIESLKGWFDSPDRYRVNTAGHQLPAQTYGNISYGGLSSWVRSARKDLAAINREIRELTLRRGGSLGKYCY